MNKFGKYLWEESNKGEDVDKILDLIGSPKNYEFGCVDIGSMVVELKEKGNYYYSNMEKVVNRLVVNNTIGASYKKRGCNGITIYAPLTTIYLNDMNVCRNALISPYWLNIIEATNFTQMLDDKNIGNCPTQSIQYGEISLKKEQYNFGKYSYVVDSLRENKK